MFPMEQVAKKAEISKFRARLAMKWRIYECKESGQSNSNLTEMRQIEERNEMQDDSYKSPIVTTLGELRKALCYLDAEEASVLSISFMRTNIRLKRLHFSV